MNLSQNLAREYRLGLQMLKQCVVQCPEDLWETGRHPRTFWRIAYHAAYFTDRYLQKDSKSFLPWAKHRETTQNLWGKPAQLNAFTKSEILEFISTIDGSIDDRLANTDLESEKSGFPLYKMSKLELQFLNLRHLQHHVGQLTELLMTRDIDIEWAGMS